MSTGIEIPLVILAGGRATRLGPLVTDCPKFLVPIDGDLVFADFQLNWARDQGFEKVILSVGYHAEKVMNYCGTGEKFGLHLSYCEDGSRALGTGGALKKACQGLQSSVALIYGDTILELPCRTIIEAYLKKPSFALLSVYLNTVSGHQPNADLLPGGKVLYSKSHPKASWRYLDYGFLVLSPQFLAQIPDQIPLDLAEPIEAASKAQKLSGYLAEKRFWEMGSPQALDEFRRRFGHSKSP